jgi:FkbM family methyltransferase
LCDHDVTGILDAGASHGRISRRLLKLFPRARVYGFEPHPKYHATLAELAATDERFKPQFIALSDSEESVELNITRSAGSSSLFRPDEALRQEYPDASTIESVETVTSVTLDEWRRRAGDVEIQLLKFDIQGAELRALAGAAQTLKTTCLAIYTEILFNPLYVGGAIYSEIDQLLRGFGFTLHDIFKPRYNGQGALMWANAIFVNRDKL